MAGWFDPLATYAVYKNLAWLNEMPAAEAHAVFADCCGSSEWARRMTDDRPYPVLDALFTNARRVWFSLSPADWLEAFSAHPKIGEKGVRSKAGERSARWSVEEQSGAQSTDRRVLTDLAEANRLYEARFGFIFIVFATGKKADEILAVCRARYGNSVETELQIAAEEQQKITELRLTKLLER